MPDFSTFWNDFINGVGGTSTSGTATIIPDAPRFTIPGQPEHTTSVIDPATGMPIFLDALREGTRAGEATVAHGFALDAAAEARRQAALNAPWMQNLQSLLMQDVNGTGLPEEALRAMFARGADTAAGTARQATASLASSLGARGINPSSGLAAGLGAQIDMARGAATRATERDVRIEALQRAAQQRASAFSNMLGLGQLQTALTTYVPTYGNDAEQGLTELIINRQAQADAVKQGKKSSNNSLIGAGIGAIGSIFGALL